MKRIKIYVESNCPYCEATKLLLDWKEIDYEEIEFTKNNINKCSETSGLDKRNPPLIFIDEEYIGGYQQLVEWITRHKL